MQRLAEREPWQPREPSKPCCNASSPRVKKGKSLDWKAFNTASTNNTRVCRVPKESDQFAPFASLCPEPPQCETKTLVIQPRSHHVHDFQPASYEAEVNAAEDMALSLGEERLSKLKARNVLSSPSFPLKVKCRFPLSGPGMVLGTYNPNQTGQKDTVPYPAMAHGKPLGHTAMRQGQFTSPSPHREFVLPIEKQPEWRRGNVSSSANLTTDDVTLAMQGTDLQASERPRPVDILATRREMPPDYYTKFTPFKGAVPGASCFFTCRAMGIGPDDAITRGEEFPKINLNYYIRHQAVSTLMR
mmetsp:Transcript_86683/g.150920  ORF Transcript_86683/g.150920 Transcript_86683/m.150920 type:complete len:301 (-) Transcript_86683:550-1452(-)